MKKRILLGISIFSLGLFLALTLLTLARPSTAATAGRWQMQALLLFGLCHAAYTLGWRQALVFFALSTGISWAFEQVGVATGLVYGEYHYSEMLGPKLGHVPLLVPIGWFMMMYPSYVIANLIVNGRFYATNRNIWRIIWLSFLGALVMTAWDVVMDPIFSGLGMWVWENGGAYFGVPIHNFAGWLATTFAVFLAYRLWERRVGVQPLGTVTPLIAALPLIAYASQMFRMFSIPDLGLIAFFAMGLPVFIAAGRLVDPPGAPRPNT
ncbi:MAG TPA: carotenoid biosynthesis protein [Caldilineae bacterium]|nr:carotenoid biosynthesis protein [Caldilineae bacterium]